MEYKRIHHRINSNVIFFHPERQWSPSSTITRTLALPSGPSQRLSSKRPSRTGIAKVSGLRGKNVFSSISMIMYFRPFLWLCIFVYFYDYVFSPISMGVYVCFFGCYILESSCILCCTITSKSHCLSSRLLSLLLSNLYDHDCSINDCKLQSFSLLPLNVGFFFSFPKEKTTSRKKKHVVSTYHFFPLGFRSCCSSKPPIYLANAVRFLATRATASCLGYVGPFPLCCNVRKFSESCIQGRIGCCTIPG